MSAADKPVLVVTKGHPFEREPFFAMFDELCGQAWTHVEHPAAEALFDVEQAERFSAFVLYDMPGIRFEPGNPVYVEPPESFKRGFVDLLQRGHGFVFLHHAIAGWPAWPEYADVVGGRFLYTPGTLRGQACADSGYRHAATHNVSVVRDHPVTAGLPTEFEITDELYLYEVFEDDVEPLLVSDYRFERDNFYSAAKVVLHGRMFDNDGWDHAPGSNLIGWTRTEGNSRIVYLQCGDDPVAYANPHFRKLLDNAMSWAMGWEEGA